MRIAIFGASGHAMDVADVCLELGYRDIIFIDYKPEQKKYFGFPLISESEVYEIVSEHYEFIIGIGDSKIRKNVYTKFKNLNYVNIVHPSATFGYKQLDEFNTKQGNFVAAGVRFTNNIRIGNFGLFNLNCTIEHDCIIEDFVTVSPGANISGNVYICEGAYIGTNASTIQGKSIKQKLIIGKYSTVGAGSVVTKNVPENAIVKGVPAS